jgi:hypothetical protein
LERGDERVDEIAQKSCKPLKKIRKIFEISTSFEFSSPLPPKVETL